MQSVDALIIVAVYIDKNKPSNPNIDEKKKNLTKILIEWGRRFHDINLKISVLKKPSKCLCTL